MKRLTFAGSVVLVVVAALRLAAQDPPAGLVQAEERLDEVERARLDLRVLEIEARMLGDRVDIYTARLLVLRDGAVRPSEDDFTTGEPKDVQVDRAAKGSEYYRRSPSKSSRSSAWRGGRSPSWRRGSRRSPRSRRAARRSAS